MAHRTPAVGREKCAECGAPATRVLQATVAPVDRRPGFEYPSCDDCVASVQMMLRSQVAMNQGGMTSPDGRLVYRDATGAQRFVGTDRKLNAAQARRI